jgi:hypothetical protein
MSVDYAKAQITADKLHATAKDGSLKIDGIKYTITFNRYAGSYDVTTPNGEHVVTFNTRSIRTAQTYLREYMA